MAESQGVLHDLYWQQRGRVGDCLSGCSSPVQAGGDKDGAIEMSFPLTSPAADPALAHTYCTQ